MDVDDSIPPPPPPPPGGMPPPPPPLPDAGVAGPARPPDGYDYSQAYSSFGNQGYGFVPKCFLSKTRICVSLSACKCPQFANWVMGCQCLHSCCVVCCLLTAESAGYDFHSKNLFARPGC